jgi:hypothetical protein
MSRYKKSGWYGNSQGHALAAKGIRTSYNASKQKLVDPLFYARQREEQVPFQHISGMVRKGQLFAEMKRMHPDADPEDLRKRGIKALSDSTLSSIDEQGVDSSVKLARFNAQLKRRMCSVLNDPQKASFLPEIKVKLLKERLQK